MHKLARLRHARVSVCLFAVATSAGFAVTFSSGDWSGSFDSTLSIGGIYRLNDPDPKFYGIANGGNAHSVNTDDGNLNFRRGWASQAFKGTHELELNYGENFSAFGRFYYLYDYELDHGNRAHTSIHPDALDRVGKRIDYLDLYGVFRFDAGSIPVDIRVGRQVVSLGESTFLPNGNNIVNPIEVSALRVPGAELREAFLPVNMIKVSADITANTYVEAFWLLEFRHTEIEPSGTFFSTNDFAGRGGDRVFLGFGSLPDSGTLGLISRGRDHEGNNYSQYGVAVRTLAPGLNDTEFGLYLAKFHSRLPLISAVTPTAPISSAFVQNYAANLVQQNLVPVMIANGVPAQALPSLLPIFIGAGLTGVPAEQVALHPQIGFLAPFYPTMQQIAAGARQVGLLTAAATGQFFLEYPEDIGMLGASFNTDLGYTGIAWQGEVSYKWDVPLQVDDVELLFATVSSLNPVFGANNQVGNYLGQYGRYVRGWRRHEVWTAQTTATKVFGPMLGASSLTVAGEVGGLWVPTLPPLGELRYEVSGTYTSGNQTAMAGTGSTLAATPLSHFADDFSWGYQLLARIEYNNLFAGINVLPSVAFSHDVSGNSPAPMANYLDGRKSLSLSVEMVWQNAWSFDLRYVNYSGGGMQNLVADRDHAAATFKYSF